MSNDVKDNMKPRRKRRVPDSLIATSFGVLGVAGLVISTGAMAGTISSLQRIQAPPEDNSPYVQVVAAFTPAKTWAEGVIKERPSFVGKTDWNVLETSRPQHPIDQKLCEMGNVPSAVTSTMEATSSGMNIRIQTYGAGQAADAFVGYKEKFSDCFSVQDVSISQGQAIVFDGGFLLTMGDAIVSGFGINNPSQQNEAVQFYARRLAETLPSSGCKDLKSVQGSNVRSPFYSPELYQGLIQKQRIDTTIPVDSVPVPKSVNVGEIKNPNTQTPEAPIPSNYPALPKNEVKKPELPAPLEEKKAADFSQYASYNIPDDQGPGCGWEWAGQHSLNYDREKMQQEADAHKKIVQSDVDTVAKGYAEKHTEWAKQVAALTPAVDQWNSYSESVNAVHDKWIYLTEERAKIEDEWKEFITRYEDWYTFDDRREVAAGKYADVLQVCVDKQEAVSDWESEWGEKSAEQIALRQMATETRENEDGEEEEIFHPDWLNEDERKILEETIPQRPEDCKELPERPAILDQQRPEEPVAPAIPSDVTIPDSWRQVSDVIKENN